MAVPGSGCGARSSERSSSGRRENVLSAVVLAFLLAGAAPACALRNVRISVPEAVRRGETARLSCDYDLEMAPLYSIKWYRGDEEFYRYVPKEAPPTQVFPLAGISVDVSQSNAKEVHLSDVKMTLSGLYKCEVSADAPFFHTDIRAAPMVVVDFADELPVLNIEKGKFVPGERIRANCSSPASYPPANITWFLNGRQLPASAVVVSPLETVLPEEGDPRKIKTPLERILSALDLDPEAALEHFYPREGGAISRHVTLRCLATIFGLYRGADEAHLVAEDSPKIASVVLGSTQGGGHHSVHRSGTSGMLATHSLNGATLTALANLLIAANAVGLR